MKIIAIDDEQLALNYLLRALEEADPNGEHIGFMSAAEALSYLSENHVDAAFTDIEMPEIDGLTLAKKIKDIRAETNIVFVTGHSYYALEAHSLYVSGYLLKPVSVDKIIIALGNLRNPIKRNTSRLFVRCFGNFEVFYNGTPLKFRYIKTKELLAYLVDRRGAATTVGELCAVLWEDKPDSLALRSQLRNLIADLTKVMKEAQCNSVIVKSRNSLAVNCNDIDCDYFSFLKKDAAAVNTYYGEYMSQYAWAEMTIGGLESIISTRNN